MARTDGRAPSRRLLRRVLALTASVLVAIVGVVLSPGTAAACSCVRHSLAEYVDRADVVFLGTVDQTRTVSRPAPRHNEMVFQVSRVFKGTAYSRQVVHAPALDSDCGISLRPGAQLVLFATTPPPSEDAGPTAVLVTGLCNGNLRTSSPPAMLGRGYPPLSGSSEQVDRATRLDRALTRALTVGGLSVLAAAALGGLGLLAVWRRRGE